MKHKNKLMLLCSLFLLIAGCSNYKNPTENPSLTSNTVNIDAYGLNTSETDVKEDSYKDIDVLSYEEEIEIVQETNYQHLAFDEAIFSPFPECTTVAIYSIVYEDVSVEESLSIIKDWVNYYGFTVDYDTELRAATTEISSGDAEDPYPLVIPNLTDLSNGNGFYLNTNECFIQMGGGNIHSMSDGRISSYLEVDSKCGLDAMGIYSENVVNEGYVSDLKDVEYQLLDGPVSIGDAANNTKIYFENGTPYFGPSGMEIEIPYVRVFSIGDIYGYVFNVRRVYNGVPFIYGDYGVYGENESYTVILDIKMAYTITGEVNAYTGTSNNCSLIPLTEETKNIIPLRDAVNILDSYIGYQMSLEIRNIDYQYCVIRINDDEIANPCWCFEGYNNSDGRMYVFFVNSINGEVYFHSYIEE